MPVILNEYNNKYGCTLVDEKTDYGLHKKTLSESLNDSGLSTNAINFSEGATLDSLAKKIDTGFTQQTLDAFNEISKQNLKNYEGSKTKYQGAFSKLDSNEENNNRAQELRNYDKYKTFSSRESLLGEKGAALLDIQDWSYKDFINERVDWQKGTSTLLNDPVWYYFKIFFKFNTNYGLLGGVIGDGKVTTDTGIEDAGYYTENTALRYLSMNQKTGNHDCLRLYDKKVMLFKFIRTLSYISSHAPWFFSSIHDANNAMTTDFDNLTKPKSITIECLEEAVDMKLMTMMDLYKNAIYDDNYQVEVVPENLRKFDMDIVVFQAPIRYLHTSSIDLKSRTTKYKSLNGSDFSTRMSFKLFTFKNCEFDYASLNGMLPSTFTNDKPFSSKPSIKINYERCYQHTSNEFAGLFFGSSGILDHHDYRSSGTSQSQQKSWFSSIKNSIKSKDPSLEGENELEEVIATGKKYNKATEPDNTRREQLKYLHEHPYYSNNNSTVYKALVDASEANLSSAMRMIDGSTAFGNLYGESEHLGRTIKNTFKETVGAAGKTYEKMGKSFIDRWKF